MSRIANLMKYSLRWGMVLPRQLANGYLDLSLLRAILQQCEINCVLDVGANIGQYATNLRRIGYTGYICSFEPVEEAYSKMRSGFHQDAKWVGFNFALGSENTQGMIHVALESTVMSSFLSPRDSGWKLRDSDVDVRRLDAIYDDVIAATKLKRPRVFLKMDTQGYDLEVFTGAENVMGQILGLHSEVSVRPLYEGMPHYLDSLRTFEQAGFVLQGMTEVARHPPNNDLVEVNCLMMRPMAFTISP